MLQSCKSSIALRVALFLAVALLPVASRPIQAQVINASLVNGSFESGSGSSIPGWTFSGAGSATIVVKGTTNTSPPVDTGNHAVLMAVPQPGTIYLGSNRVGVSPNLRYRFTARLKAATQNQQGALHAVEWGANNVQLRDTTLALSSGLNANWETLRGYLVTLAGTQSVEIRLMPVLPQGGSAQLYWDSVDLTRGDATAWEPWETTLTSTLDYSPPAANPYKDLILTATFFSVPSTSCPAAPPTLCAGAGCFQGYGFWDGVPGTSSSRTFKIRTLLPAGNWCWAVTCAGPSSQCSATTEPGLNTHSAMPVVVLANVTPANKLYALGMPRMSSNSRFLVYGDQATTFPWIADTAWMAPVGYTPGSDPVPSHDLWSSYLWDRVHKNFTTILVAPAPQYLQPPLPANVLGFRGMPNCRPLVTTVVPNECTYWDAPYWQKFDQMVRTANNAGLMIVVAGVMDPMDRSGTNTQNLNEKFPNPDAAVVFARNFAARLAGSYVIFSPAFDDRQYDLTVDGRTARDSMKAVGTALKVGGLPYSPIAAVPRHLVVNHLAGGSSLSDYDLFQNDPWLSFQMFQSGHGSNAINASVQCPYIDAWTYSICRARELALRFRCMGDPSIPSLPCPTQRSTLTVKPATNSEAAYETYSSIEGTIVDHPIGVRNTAYATALSGSFGVTLGVEGIYKWTNPGIFSDSYSGNQSRSDNDLALLASLFRGAPWTDLTPRHNLIVGNSTNEKQKTLLAGSSTYALVYAPDLTGKTGVTLSTTASNSLSGLNCNSWSAMWVSPVAGSTASKLASCSTLTQGQIAFSRLPSCVSGACEWVLKLTANSAPPPPNGLASNPTNNLMVWSSEAPDGSTADILGQFLDTDGNPVGDPLTIQSDGATFGKLPTVALDSTGNFLVAWQTEFADGTLDSISTRWLDSNGNPLGETTQMAAGSDGQQAEPAIASDFSGNVILTWTAYAPDGSTSEIYRKDVLDGGPPPDSAMLVSDPNQTESSSSQVQASAQGGSVVAWNGTDRITGAQGVYFQRFGPRGRPIGQQRQVGRQALGRRRLVKLFIDSQGSFRIRSERFDSSDAFLGIFEQNYRSDGGENGTETQVNPGS